jgi:hypothetical protein
MTYLAQTAVVAAVWGPLVSVAYLASLPIAADINFYLSDRLRRAVHRARAFVRFRRDPALHRRLLEELSDLRVDVLAFDRALDERAGAGTT